MSLTDAISNHLAPVMSGVIAKYMSAQDIQFISGRMTPAQMCEYGLSEGYPAAVICGIEHGAPPTLKMMRTAAARGDVSMMDQLRQHVCPWSAVVVSIAALNGYLDAVRWLIERGCPVSRDLPGITASMGHMHILRWLDVQGMEFSERTCAFAAESGDISVMQWLRKSNCDRHECRGCKKTITPWNKVTCEYAAEYNQLGLLQWLRSQDPPCPWDSSTVWEADVSGHHEIHQWAIANGCPV